ncbi:hypothetical protein GIB67_031741 [Kingdonia uniflora]|uniref:Protein DA1-like domain-containing protein n=1 Tax=Kingdonia uniflora TaxID=39325 RepID=A0A7J7NKJ9_9MAGN|nr:hypothetical protein GIB67_031741 [Kingdonia uniflora]
MGWLNKIFKGSSHKISEGQYHGKLNDDRVWDEPSNSVDSWTEHENDDIDCAIALSLSEEEEKGKKHFIPTNAGGLIEYRAHPFWNQKYCPSHEHDGTPRCCSCERMEPRDPQHISLDDGWKLCLECLDSAIMDTKECQPLYLDIQEFYEGLNMKIEQQVPLLLIERTTLNDAMEGEKNGHHHMPETRGLCLSEEQTVSTILKRQRIGRGNKIMEMIAELYRLTRRCKVTAILILYGLPRLYDKSYM